METLFNNHGVDRQDILDDISRDLSESKAIYYQRITGAMPHLWSATTRCVKCGKWWMWGIKNNLNFVCDKCK